MGKTQRSARRAPGRSASASALLQPTAQGDINAQMAALQRQLDVLKKRAEKDTHARQKQADIARRKAAAQRPVNPPPLRNMRARPDRGR